MPAPTMTGTAALARSSESAVKTAARPPLSCTRHSGAPEVCPPPRLILPRWAIGIVPLLVVPLAHAAHPSKSREVPKNGGVIVSKGSQTVEGRVMEVRRISRQVTVRTRQGTLERVTIPREAAVKAPHGERGLSGIRRGMTVRIAHGVGSQGLVAHQVVAHTAQPEGRPAGHRVAH